MSANVIIFEGQYIADLIRNMDKAKQLTEEAMGIIKKANQHRNWKCKETTEINNSLDTISNRVQRLNIGMMRTNIALECVHIKIASKIIASCITAINIMSSLS